jgi:RNA polymerase sigma-70 factor (ECF subfamily)
LRNRCLDHLKEARRRDVPLDAAGAVPVDAETPDTRVDRRRLRADLRAAFLALPDAQREAFLLHHVHDVPYEAMAAMLDQSQSALKMRVHRARQALSAMLRGRGVTGPAHARPTYGHVETFGIGHTQEES